jgi:hypothetical protein
VTGVLTEPYTAQGLRFQRGTTSTAEVQIHHVVALSDAWQTGTQYWAGNLRVDFGNDPLNLLTGDGRTNGAKDDGDGAKWLPANKARRLRLCGSNRGREGTLPLMGHAGRARRESPVSCRPALAGRRPVRASRRVERWDRSI